jgi:hypothetical protein
MRGSNPRPRACEAPRESRKVQLVVGLQRVTPPVCGEATYRTALLTEVNGHRADTGFVRRSAIPFGYLVMRQLMELDAGQVHCW